MTPTAARAFVRRHTTPRPVGGLAAIQLHQAGDALELWRATQLETGDPEAPLPYWAFAWAGGLALATYIGHNPAAVRGRQVVDLGSGSGLVAIAAALAGAAHTIAIDIDPLAMAAIDLNARLNGVRLTSLRRDILDEDGPPPNTDVILAADCWYDQAFGARATAYLRRAASAGIETLVGDPGRRYLPTADLTQLAAYEVRTTTDLEDLDQALGRVYRLRRYASARG